MRSHASASAFSGQESRRTERTSPGQRGKSSSLEVLGLKASWLVPKTSTYRIAGPGYARPGVTEPVKMMSSASRGKRRSSIVFIMPARLNVAIWISSGENPASRAIFAIV